MNAPHHPPRISVVVVCHEMAAQVENTLHSLLPPYQRNGPGAACEIVLMDNGSSRPLNEHMQKLSPNLRYVYIPPAEASPNPGVALNRGAALARAPLLCLMIDGARMVTPGVLAWGMQLMGLRPRGMVEVRGWHLGPKYQPESIMEGYDERAEKELLEKVRWRENGYRLFEIAAASAQTRFGISRPASESNCLFLSRALFAELGGMNESYAAPGGGLVNLDFYARAAAAADLVWTLLGEGTFHQAHGGAATGRTLPELRKLREVWDAESMRLRGPLPKVEQKKYVVAGHIPMEFQRWMSAVTPRPGGSMD